MAAPARDARGSPLPGVQRRSALGRVQGDNACSESRGEAFGPRHFAGFRRKTESVIVGSYIFAESAAPPSPRAPNEPSSHPRKKGGASMARNDGVDRTTVRNQPRTESNIADAEAHNERQKAWLPERGYRPRTQSSEHPLQGAFRQLSGDVPADGAGRHHLYPGSQAGRRPLRRAGLRRQLRIFSQSRRLRIRQGVLRRGIPGPPSILSAASSTFYLP